MIDRGRIIGWRVSQSLNFIYTIRPREVGHSEGGWKAEGVGGGEVALRRTDCVREQKQRCRSSDRNSSNSVFASLQRLTRRIELTREILDWLSEVGCTSRGEVARV